MTVSAAQALRLLAQDLRANPTQFTTINVIGAQVGGNAPVNISAHGGNGTGNTTIGMQAGVTWNGELERQVEAASAEDEERLAEWAARLEELAVAAEEGTPSTLQRVLGHVVDTVPSVIATAAKLLIENLAH